MNKGIMELEKVQSMNRELTDAEVKALTELSYEKSIKKGNNMNKELEALSNLSFFIKLTNPRYGEELDFIEKALKDNQKIMNKLSNEIKHLKATNRRNEKKLKVLEIIKENIGLKMSVDDNVGCLYVPIVKTFEPLEKNIVVVGFV